MYKRIDFTKLEGLAVYQDTLDFLQTSYRDAISAIAKGFGSKVIVTGVIYQPSANSYTDGWVVIDGELMPFVGGLKADRVIIDEAPGTELFGDGSTQTVYFTRSAKLGITGGYAFSDFIRIDTLSSISEGLKNLVVAHNNLQVSFNNYKPNWGDIQNIPGSFNPSYHRHNWGDIDNKPNLITYLWKDSVHIGDVWQEEVRTIGFPNVGRTDYIVAAHMISLSGNSTYDNDVIWLIRNKTATSFQLALNEINNPDQNLQFEYMLIAPL